MRKANWIIFFLAIAGKSFCQNADINILKKINLGRSEAMNRASRTVSNSVTPLTLAVPAGLIACALIQKDSASKGKAIVVAGALAITGLVTTGMKYSIQRPRPFETYPFIEKRAPGGGFSFPSGHTSAAFALATSASMSYPKWYVIVPSYAWAGAVGYSRMELGVHYPSDVLAAAIIGSGSAWLSRKLNKWINQKRNPDITRHQLRNSAGVSRPVITGRMNILEKR